MNIYEQVKITEDGRVTIPTFEVRLFGGCNLKCKNCSAFAPIINDWQFSFEEVFHIICGALSRFKTNDFALYGGEPLLHPEIMRIINVACSLAEEHPCTMTLVTNGVLLKERLDELVVQSKQHPNFQIMVSIHTPQIGKMLKKDVFPVFDREGIRYHFNDIGTFVVKTPGILYNDKHKAFYKFNDPKNSECDTYLPDCNAVVGSRYFRCVCQASRILLCQHGLKNGKSIQQDYIRAVNQYNGICLKTATAVEIRNYMLERPYGECRFCKEEFIEEPQVQLTKAEIKKWSAGFQ